MFCCVCPSVSQMYISEDLRCVLTVSTYKSTFCSVFLSDVAVTVSELNESKWSCEAYIFHLFSVVCSL